MRTEQDLRAALRDQADSSPPPNVAALIATAQQGRTPTPRRRLGIVSAGVAVLLIALAAPFLHRVIPDRTAASRSAPKSTTPARVVPTPQWVAQTLINLIGRGGTVSGVTGHGGANYATATFTFDDGHGAALVYITTAWPARKAAGGPTLVRTGCRSQSTTDSSPGDIRWGTETLTCTTLADGTQLGVGQPRRPASAGQAYGLALNNVSVLRPDGFEILIGVFNKPILPTSTSGPVVTTRAEPPFTAAELTTVAVSKRWTASVSAAAVESARTLFPTASTTVRTR